MQCPQREWAFLGSSHGFSLLLKRNCSISPKGMVLVFALLAVVTLGIATGFALAGAWLILPFAGLEVAALVLAFVCTARHAADYERIDAAPGRVRVEVAEGRAVRRQEFAGGALRVHDAPERACVVLTGAGAGEIEVGRHLDAERRVALAQTLRRTLSF
ncbi:MAG: DUF2244 domain-containing protein [Burkholderiales bacterium]|nr:DUF2244 domain-containing protein [Burkholderiales bacterium]